MKSFVSQLSFILVGAFLLNACTQRPSDKSEELSLADKAAFHQTLSTHLEAVSQKNLATLATTLAPDSTFFLILPGNELEKTSSSFLEMHREWFQDTSWTFDFEILEEVADKTVGFAIVEVLYREPDRNGAPYFNRMLLTYGLRKYQGEWFVIMDHASSVEKTP